MGLNGRAALDARGATEQSIDAAIKELGGKMLSDTQKQAFSARAGAYRNSFTGQVGSHANSQADVWYGEVNKSTADTALDQIANSPDDPSILASSSVALISAYRKTAELAGAQPGDEVWTEAGAKGKQAILAARVTAIGTRDPSRALRLLEDSRATAGTQYDNLYTGLRTRADEQAGIAAGDAALTAATTNATQTAATSYSNPDLPVYHDTVAVIPGGMSSAGLARTVAIESSGKPEVVNASGHKGLGQFSDATWKAYGNGDPLNPNEAIAGIQRYAAANASYLTQRIGRPPTDVELYLAHQQGPGGAASLLLNPDAPAASLIGAKAVIQNGGKQGMTAREFVGMWTQRFNGTQAMTQLDRGLAPSVAPPPEDATIAPPVVPMAGNGVAPELTKAPEAPEALPLRLSTSDITSTPKADAIQAVLDNHDLTPEAQAHALVFINKRYAAMQIASDQTTKQKKQVNDDAANEYVTQILSGNGVGLGDKIAVDPRLDASTKLSLNTALSAHADQSVSGAIEAYGSGYYKAFSQIIAPLGDPSRISDANSILRLAMPGPNGEMPTVSMAGAQKLLTIMGQNAKSVDQQAVNTTKAGLFNYAKSKLSFQQDTGPVQIRDPDGEKLFNAVFIPKFEAAFAADQTGGKDPWQFLTQDNIDKMIAGLRNPREMAMAKMLAEQTGMGVDQIAAPAAPAGVDEDGWKLAVNSTPKLKNGQAWPVENWAQVITALQKNPTPDVMAQFDAKFAASGISAQNILDVLGRKPKKTEEGVAAGVIQPAETGNEDYLGAHAMINGHVDLALPLPAGQ